MDKAKFDKLTEDGFLNAKVQGNYTLYNYTPQTMYSRAWDEYTLAARGLILDNSGRPIARPFPKFFNLNEHDSTRPETLPAEVPELSDKYDGSLIICFYNRHESYWQCVTRGSWDSEQAQWANKWVRNHAHKLHQEYTYLFELIAPWNRIVIPYPQEDMVLLGRVNTETGEDCTYACAVEIAREDGFTPLKFESKPLSSLNMADDSIKDAEGFVARFSNGLRVKLKYDEYKRLHKLITGLSVKAIWEGLADGINTPPADVPDEFFQWWTMNKTEIEGAFNSIDLRARRVFADTPKFINRKEYAAHFLKHKDIASVLFRMLDGDEYASQIWKQVKPQRNQVFKQDDL